MSLISLRGLIASVAYMPNLKSMPTLLTLQLPDQICNSPYCQPYISCNISSENLVLDQSIIPKLNSFYILITNWLILHG